MSRSVWGPVNEMSSEEVRRAIGDRQHLLRHEAEDYLRQQSLALPERRKRLWRWDYSCEEAFARSVEPNRRRWLQAVGEFRPTAEDGEQPDPSSQAPEFAPFFESDAFSAQWVSLPFLGGYRAQAVLALPRRGQGPYPLVVAQHGVASSPERVFGFDDPTNIYHAYGRRLAEDGFAVLAPLNATESAPRERLQRMALMLGGTLWGLEISRISRLLDYVVTREEIDAASMGMWGISLGGAYTMFTMPLEPRLRAGVVTAWFNQRVNKMVIDDPRYSCFLSTQEEHIFIPGWLREFDDSDLASLICPRPLQVQAGKGDGIAWWPQLAEEFERAAVHYSRLGVGGRIELDLHEGGHEIDVEAGLAFLRIWLKGSRC
ncbi:MAG: dienelactone hydrolase family protein [Anaerolineae bacterium]